MKFTVDAKLKRVNDNFFNDIFVGERWATKKDYTHVLRRVVCITDDNCVRYVVYENGKKLRTSEFSNDQKEKCFCNAVKALNR